MNIPASISRPFNAQGTHNSAVESDGLVDFTKAPITGFAWTQSRLPVLPFVPAARYYIGDLSPAARAHVIQEAVFAALDYQASFAVTGASVTASDSHLEVWARPGWHPGTNGMIREAIESSLATYERAEAPTSRLGKIFSSADRQRAQKASDRREQFLENLADRVLFGS
jgi:hypothetical protein